MVQAELLPIFKFPLPWQQGFV